MDKELKEALIVLSEQAGREIDTYRHRQISTFREFAIVQAVITWGIGQLKITGGDLRNTRYLGAIVCFFAGVLGCWMIQIYKRRIYFVRDKRKKLVSPLLALVPLVPPKSADQNQSSTGIEDLFYPARQGRVSRLLDVPSSTAYTLALAIVSVATAIANIMTTSGPSITLVP